MKDEMERVLRILTAESHDLSVLAEMSGVQMDRFFNYADLRGLDLRGQDLCGLNFDWADLRGADLTNVRITMGSLNNAEVDQKFDELQDEFDCYLEDVKYHQIKKMAIFARFRPTLIDRLAKSMHRNLKDLAEDLGIGTSTLRRMRNSESVSVDTLIRVRENISALDTPFSRNQDHLEVLDEIVKQPCIQFGEYDFDDFSPLKRSDVVSYIKMVDQLNQLITTSYRDNKGYFNWSMKPTNIPDYMRYRRNLLAGAADIFERVEDSREDLDRLPLFNND